ncbi:MAG: hypothetical protein WKF97_13800 [Chitinophagaceae bacterium]
MTLTDWTGSVGVTILLIAYFLNLKDKIAKDSLTYLFLNLLGAGIACVASVLLKYLPFIILEGCWTLISAVGLFNHLNKIMKVRGKFI